MQLDNLILDLNEDFRKFRQQLRPVFENRFDNFARETIQTILEFVHGASEGRGMVQEMADQMEELAAEEGRSDEEVQVIKEACEQFGLALFEHLIEIGAYDAHGHLGFKLARIMGDDIVLRPLTPEDLAGEFEDVDPSNVEDVNKIAEQRAEEDVASLYEGNPYDALVPVDEDSGEMVDD